MMRDKRLILGILFLMPFLLSAQNLKIVGKTNKPNALVRLVAYNDMFTMEQTTIAETRSDFIGNFSFNTVIQHVTPAQIAVNLDRVDMIVSPGSFYDVEVFIPEKRYDVSIFEQEQPLLKINTAKDGGINEQLIVAESVINDFVYDNINAITAGGGSYLIDTLENRVNKTLGANKNDYVNDFIRYKLAALKMAASPNSISKIISQYFDNQPVLYLQSSYMDLFNEIFDGFFASRDFNRSDLLGSIYSGYDNFIAYLKKNDFLSRNPQLLEVIVMNYLQQIYYENSELHGAAFDFINIIKNTSEYQQNKALATNLLTRMRRLSYNSDAPAFSLKDKDGQIVRLSDYQDKLLLLQFVDRVSDMTNYQFSTLNDMQRQWNDTIAVVTIATKESFDEYVKLFENQQYNWQLLNLGDDILLLEDYGIKTCPDYVILKTKGRIGMAPAPSPDHYLEHHVRRIYHNR